MDSKNSLENNRSQTYRAILIHKILQDICTEKMANGCRKPFDINAEIEILSNKIADNLDSDIEEENEKDESEKIEEIYNDIVEIFKRNAKNSADFYYNDLCEEIASCIVKCLVEPKKEAHCEDLFSINEAVCMLLDLDLDCILVARNNFTTCVNGAIDILLGGERSKIYDIRLVTFVETWFLEINNAVMDMHERVKRGILSGSLKSIRDDTYYIKSEDLHEWARSRGLVLINRSDEKIDNNKDLGCCDTKCSEFIRDTNEAKAASVEEVIHTEIGEDSTTQTDEQCFFSTIETINEWNKAQQMNKRVAKYLDCALMTWLRSIEQDNGEGKQAVLSEKYKKSLPTIREWTSRGILEGKKLGLPPLS